jgi:hypothetical protein
MGGRRHCTSIVLSAVIPEAAQRLSGIHNPGCGVWIPGSRLWRAPE